MRPGGPTAPQCRKDFNVTAPFNDMMTCEARWTARVILVLAILGLLLTVTAPLVPSAPPFPPIPYVEVALTAPSPVTIGPDDYEQVAISGTVSYGNLRQGTTIEINASTDNYWAVEFEPKTATVPVNFEVGSLSVSIQVRVPPKAASNRPAKLTLEAIATTPPPLPLNYTDYATVDVGVRQYFGLRLDSNHTASVEQGKSVNNRWRVWNTGNGPDNFTVELTNAAEVSAKGLSLGFPPRLADLGQERAESVSVAINATRNATVGTVVAKFRVSSVGDPTKADSYSLTVIVTQASSTDGDGDGDGGDGGDDSPGPTAAASVIVIAALAALVARRRSAA